MLWAGIWLGLLSAPRRFDPEGKKRKEYNDLKFSFSNDLTGAANIVDHDAAGPRTDKEVVPDAAVRPSTDDQDHHVGRGGAGNEHLAPGHEHHHDSKKKKEGQPPTGLADKLKAKIVGVFKK